MYTSGNCTRRISILWTWGTICVIKIQTAQFCTNSASSNQPHPENPTICEGLGRLPHTVVPHLKTCSGSLPWGFTLYSNEVKYYKRIFFVSDFLLSIQKVWSSRSYDQVWEKWTAIKYTLPSIIQLLSIFKRRCFGPFCWVPHLWSLPLSSLPYGAFM